MMDDKTIRDAAEACYGQFISSKPKHADYVGGFIVGAMWAQATIWVEAPLPLAWTTEPPKVAGHYLFWRNDGLMPHTFFMGVHDAVPAMSCWWYGPIPEPQEATP